ncbi:Beta-galactosidase [Symbiodinium microadriaticum]|uniref:Beta-galactosidase n=1 Tax=Symbiodinium microadriaticum TaxID=2951 RepID=A0A1Q9EBK8_SYMMI|nr:Beta-galactosidase [Symbiodinium microadriaticum]
MGAYIASSAHARHAPALAPAVLQQRSAVKVGGGAGEKEQSRLNSDDLQTEVSTQKVQPVLLKQAVFTTAKGQDAGVSICRLCRAGRWQQVPVSHSLPCRSFPPKLSAEMQVPDSRALAFSSSCSGALWVPLLEKAWARINGSFQAAERGDSAEALAALTGAPAKHYRLHPESAGSQWGVSSMLSAYISPGNWASWAGLGISSLFWGRGKPWDLALQPAKHRRHWMQHAFAMRMLPSFALVVAASSIDCNQRWHQEDLTGLYLRLSQWDREGVKETHNFYDVFSTFILLARGASFARLPSLEEEVGMDQVARGRLLDSLARLGGYPERCGICIAAEDTVSEGIDSRFRIGTVARASSLDSAVGQHVKQRLPAGKYCHALALDRRHWDDLHVSPLEIQEMFARDVVHGRQVLLLRGPSAPEDSEMRAALRFAASVRAVTVSTSMLLGALDEMIADMAGLLVGIDLLLLLGLPTGFGALLAVELSCRYSVQALDVGQLSLTAPPGKKPAAPLTTLGSSGQTPHWAPRLHRTVAQHISLNGLWEVQITTDTARLQDLAEGDWRTIEVPFAPQSHKGLATKVSASEAVWYRRMLRVPESWCAGVGATFWLQVDACDWECAVYLDSQPLGIHRGGYDAFRLEIPAISACSERGQGPEVKTLLVRAWDPTDEGCPFTDHPPIPCDSCCESGWQPRGKQALKPGSIMYTAVTGIWRQGIFLENLPGCHIRNLHIRVYKDAPRKLTVAAEATCEKQLYLEVRDLEGDLLGVAHGPCCELHAELEQALQLWSPQEPQRYEAHLSLGADTDVDTVVRRFARRFVAVKDGRFLLNDQVLFVHGVLYQGYWPESLLTPPDSEAISRDLEMIKAAGFNTVRVHAVVMGEAFYDECDKLGLLVWQDMPAGDMRAMPTWSEGRAVAEEEIGTEAQRLKVPVPRTLFDEIRRSHESRRAFEAELQAMVGALSHFASVAVWVLFNEGWGQSNTKALVQFLRGIDPSRLIDANSGWNEVEGGPLGDFADLHNYEDNSSIFGPLAMSFQNFAAWGYTVGDGPS